MLEKQEAHESWRTASWWRAATGTMSFCGQTNPLSAIRYPKTGACPLLVVGSLRNVPGHNGVSSNHVASCPSCLRSLCFIKIIWVIQASCFIYSTAIRAARCGPISLLGSGWQGWLLWGCGIGFPFLTCVREPQGWVGRWLMAKAPNQMHSFNMFIQH